MLKKISFLTVVFFGFGFYLMSVAQDSKFSEFKNDYKAIFGEEPSSVWSQDNKSCSGVWTYR